PEVHAQLLGWVERRFKGIPAEALSGRVCDVHVRHTRRVGPDRVRLLLRESAGQRVGEASKIADVNEGQARDVGLSAELDPERVTRGRRAKPRVLNVLKIGFVDSEL